MATEVEIEKLVTTLTANTAGFETGMRRSQDVIKATELAAKSSGAQVQDFYKELKEFAESTHSGIEALGVEGWFKDLTREIKTASSAVGDLGPAVTAVVRPIESAGGALGRWTDVYTKMKTSLGDKGVFEKAKELFVSVTTTIGATVTAIVPMVKTAFASMATAVVSSIKAITVAMMASPAIFLVAAAAVVAAVALIAGSVLKVQKHADETKKIITKIEEGSEKRREDSAKDFEKDQQQSDTLRGAAQTKFDQERLLKLQKQVDDATKAREEVEKRIKVSTTFRLRGDALDYLGLSRKAKTDATALEQRKEDEAQAKKDRDKVEQDLREKPLRDIAALHKNLDEDTALIGLKGTDRELKKIEMQLQRNIDLREFWVEELGWDEEEEDVVKLDEAIARTTVSLNRYRDAAKDNKNVHAVQQTKEQFEGLQKSLMGTIDRLKYVGDEWEVYHAKQQARDRGAKLTDDQEDQLRELVQDRKILQDRKKLQEEEDQLVKKYRTPAEKFQDDMGRLMEINREGNLPQETFAKGVEEITKEFNKAELAIQKAKAAVTQFDGAIVGSAESARRLEKYREQYELMKAAADKPNIVLAQREKTSEEKFAQLDTEVYPPGFVGPKFSPFVGPGRDPFVGPRAEDEDFADLFDEGMTRALEGVAPVLTPQSIAESLASALSSGGIFQDVGARLTQIVELLGDISDESESEEVDFGGD